jgi:hypothetical protein
MDALRGGEKDWDRPVNHLPGIEAGEPPNQPNKREGSFMSEEHKWDDFQALVTWATWEIMQGLTKGEPLRSLVFRVLSAARTAQFRE